MKKTVERVFYVFYLIGTRFFAILPKRLQRLALQVFHSLEEATESAEATSQADSIGFEGRWIRSVEAKPINEMNLVQSVVSTYRKEKDAQLNMPAAYQPAGVWGNDRLRVRLSPLERAISGGDLLTTAGFLRNFFRNGAISGLWDSEDVFERFCRLNKIEQVIRMNTMLKEYSVWRENLPLTPAKELDAPRVGNPWGYNFQGMLLYEPVFEYNYQAHYFAQLLAGLQSPVVLEIGGGFGGLACHLLRCFPSVKYIGIDLPENILIQTYYLSSIFPDARILTCLKDSSSLDKSLLDQYDIVLLPNFDLPRIASGVIDLIVNVRSLSEMSYDAIGEYFRQIDRIGCLYFFHENICRARHGDMPRIPVSEFPGLENFKLIASSESRWPKWRGKSWFPCRENLYIDRNSLYANPTQKATSVKITTPFKIAQPPTMTQPTASSPIPLQTVNRNIIIDHTNWNWYNSQPPKVIDGVALLQIFFAHASIGVNILQGFADLHSSNQSKYPLGQVSSGAKPPAATTDGIIYEYSRGNPGWKTKLSTFEIYINNGWRYPNVNIAMNKLCAIDQNVDWVAYCNNLAKLEVAYPDTSFIYMTIPYYSTSDGDNVLRNLFNRNLRNWISQQSKKILFDIANIEAWSPGGNRETFATRDNTYEKLYPGYSLDGVHLNGEGSRRMAIAFYSLFGQVLDLRRPRASSANDVPRS